MPGTIIFEKGKDFISQAIIQAQNLFWQDHDKQSQWSHIGFIGSDSRFYESTVKFTRKGFVYGIRISRQKKILKEIYKSDEKIGIQNKFVQITDDDWKKITEKAISLKKAKYTYGGLELIGTLLVILKWKLTRDPEKKEKILREHNPFDIKESVYCIAFVADCLAAAGKEYLNIQHSISTVDHGWFTDLEHDSKVIEIKT